MASCVAVLSSVNHPLFVRSATPARLLADQYALHTSLDVVEEKTAPATAAAGSATGSAAARKAGEPTRELYLGSLFSTEKQKVFGYVTNTRIKFIVIVDASNTALRDNEIRQMFRKLHTAYTQLMSNPFYVPGDEIKSTNFEKVVQGLMVKA